MSNLLSQAGLVFIQCCGLGRRGSRGVLLITRECLDGVSGVLFVELFSVAPDQHARIVVTQEAAQPFCGDQLSIVKAFCGAIGIDQWSFEMTFGGRISCWQQLPAPQIDLWSLLILGNIDAVALNGFLDQWQLTG